MDTTPPGSSRPLTEARRLLLALVADQAEDREMLSTSFATDPTHRIMVSVSLGDAPAAIERQPIDMIIGFVDSDAGWQSFKTIAARFPEKFTVLLLSDPDGEGVPQDGRFLNAVVRMGRDQLAAGALRVAGGVVHMSGPAGTPVETADPIDRARLESLSDRELEVLVHTANGLAIKQIARALGRSYATVATHRTNIMDKLGLHDKVALTRFAIRNGLIEA